MKIAFVILTCESFLNEAYIVKKKLSKNKIYNFANCYFASKNIDLLNNDNSNYWKNIEIPKECNNWGEELKFVTGFLNEEYLFLWLDDFYPTKFINFEKLFKYIKKAIEYKPSVIRINSIFNKRNALVKKEYNIYRESKKHRYISSTVLAIFEKKFLQKITHEDDTPWGFERFSKNRFVFSQNLFLYIKSPEINLINIVIKGKLMNSSLNKLDKRDKEFILQNSRHKKMNIFNEICYLLKLSFLRMFYYPFSYHK